MSKMIRSLISMLTFLTFGLAINSKYINEMMQSHPFELIDFSEDLKTYAMSDDVIVNNGKFLPKRNSVYVDFDAFNKNFVIFFEKNSTNGMSLKNVSIDGKSIAINNSLILHKNSTLDGSIQDGAHLYHLKFMPNKILRSKIGYTYNDSATAIFEERAPLGNPWIVTTRKPHLYKLQGTQACDVLLVIDHTLHKRFNDPSRTINYAYKLFHTAASFIKMADINMDNIPDLINMRMVDYHIYRSKFDLHYPFKNEAMTPKKMLLKLSNIPQEQKYCLVIMLTFRKFDKGIYSAGFYNSLCASQNGHYFNVIITTVRDGDDKIMNLLAAARILTHQIGHSMGATHDPEDGECSMFDNEDTFIMFPTILIGLPFENNAFSVCSLKEMQSYLFRSESCLEHMYPNYCGNGIREGDEECDCGTVEMCNKIDPCCTPLGLEDTSQKACTFRKAFNFECSPLHSECCSRECITTQQMEKKACNHYLNECLEPVLCDGLNETCPLANMPDRTLCHGNTRSCIGGQCLGTLCGGLGLMDCQCEKKGDECDICCVQNDECKSVRNVHEASIAAGRSCNQDTGICTEKFMKDNWCEYKNFDQTLNEGISYLDPVGTEILYTFYLVYLIIYLIFAYMIINKAGKLQNDTIEMVTFYSYVEDYKSEINSAYKPNLSTELARLVTLFPTAHMRMLKLAILEANYCEEKAVADLLMKGLPIRTSFKAEGRVNNFLAKHVCI